MRVLVTGGTGAVGKATVERLVDHGWDVRVIGRRAGFEIPGAEYQVCDITNYDDLRVKMHGCQTVVHLAAVPNPMIVPVPNSFISTRSERTTCMKRLLLKASPNSCRPARSTRLDVSGAIRTG